MTELHDKLALTRKHLAVDWDRREEDRHVTGLARRFERDKRRRTMKLATRKELRFTRRWVRLGFGCVGQGVLPPRCGIST